MQQTLHRAEFFEARGLLPVVLPVRHQLAGVSDVLVARWLGHADTSMVHEHYGHLLSYHSDINRVQIGPPKPT